METEQRRRGFIEEKGIIILASLKWQMGSLYKRANMALTVVGFLNALWALWAFGCFS